MKNWVAVFGLSFCFLVVVVASALSEVAEVLLSLGYKLARRF
jgi:hypothetical protein